MATVSIPACTTVVLLDIEGTTTPITFVKVSLFVFTVESIGWLSHVLLLQTDRFNALH